MRLQVFFKRKEHKQILISTRFCIKDFSSALDRYALGTQTFNNCSYTLLLADLYSLNSHLYVIDFTVLKRRFRKIVVHVSGKSYPPYSLVNNSLPSMNVATFFLGRIF